MPKPIDFAALAQVLLDRAYDLVSSWLPNGYKKREGAFERYYIGSLDGEKGTSCNINLTTGTWIDNGTDEKGGDLISLYAAIHRLDQGEAARELMAQLGLTKASPSTPIQTSGRRTERPAPPDDAEPAKADKWRVIVPVPDMAPVPTFKHHHYGVADHHWEYRFDGKLYGYVCRYDRAPSEKRPNGGKEITPLTWCVDESDGNGTQRWHAKQWPEPRPLYVPRGHWSPDNLPVLAVEGEKCALAAHTLLADHFDTLTWPGGGKTAAMAAWEWIRDRTVYLWPDCDAQRERLNAAEKAAGIDRATKPLLPEGKQPGMKTMVDLARMLVTSFGCTVMMIPIPKPGDVADGWDVGDAILHQGWGQDQVLAFIRAAKPWEAQPDDAPNPRPAAGAGRKASELWQSYLLTTPRHEIRPVRENVVLAMDGVGPDVPGIPEVKGLIRFNEFTNNVEKVRDTPWGTQAGAWEEADELMMGEWLVRNHGLPSMSRGHLEEATLMIARKHAFHPVRERIEGLRGKWDRKKRLSTWIERCLIAEGCESLEDPFLSPYLARVGTWFVMAFCSRVMTTRKQGAKIICGPGVKFDNMLILEGPQGWGKSTVASVFGGEYFADTGLTIGDKDSLQNIQGISIYEWAELENMSKQEVGKVKQFVSSSKDRFRASFDRRPRDYPRQVVFVGTTNESNYLSDITGNRRFWPVRVTRRPDIEWLRENLEQLLAEAVMYVDADERFYPTPKEQRELFDPQQRARTLESSIESYIRRFLYDEAQKVNPGCINGSLVDEISLAELLDCIGYSIDKQTDVVVKRAGSVLHALDWQIRRTSLPGRPRVYVRPKDIVNKPAQVQGHQPEGATYDCPF